MEACSAAERKEHVTTHPVLEGKVAVVTGAAMGMGEATAELFAEAGLKGTALCLKYELQHLLAQGSLWRASDASSYVTGTTLHVDAGYVGR